MAHLVSDCDDFARAIGKGDDLRFAVLAVEEVAVVQGGRLDAHLNLSLAESGGGVFAQGNSVGSGLDGIAFHGDLGVMIPRRAVVANSSRAFFLQLFALRGVRLRV